MKRKEILPKWIRFFAWLHLLCFLAIPIFIIGLFGEASLTAFGLSYSGSSLQLKAIWITVICALAGLAAVGILWGKNWAISLAIPYAYLAILTNCVAVAIAFATGNIYIPFDPFLLIPFMVILSKNKKRWKYFNTEQDERISNQQLELM